MTDDQAWIMIALLTEIRDALTVDDPVDEGCSHPDEKRISLATLRDPDHWVCGVCRFEHVGMTKS